MTDITRFIYDDQPVRVVTIGGEPWFVGRDVANALGYADTTNAIKQHCKGVANHHPLETAGGTQMVRVLAESDVMRLIVSSKLPSAQEFERQVFEEILPSVRRRGGYLTPEATEAALTDPDFIIRLATDLKVERARRAEAEERAEILAPKAEAFDGFLSTAGDMSVNEAAKEVSRAAGVIIGERRLRDAMQRWGWIYRDGTGAPRAYQAQIELGRLAEKARWHHHPVTGEKVLDTPQVRVTAKGAEAARVRLAKDVAA